MDGIPDKFAPVKTIMVNKKTYAKKSVIHTIDTYGNTTEYTIEILYYMNATAIILIVLGILLLTGGITSVIVLFRKGKFIKKNKNDKAGLKDAKKRMK